jgi:amino acid transporter
MNQSSGIKILEELGLALFAILLVVGNVAYRSKNPFKKQQFTAGQKRIRKTAKIVLGIVVGVAVLTNIYSFGYLTTSKDSTKFELITYAPIVIGLIIVFTYGIIRNRDQWK